MLQLSRILTAAGLVAASVGLTFYGIVESQWETDKTQSNLSLALMIVGVIASIVGIVLYRQTTTD
ncbi:MAG TPA: hypothetical protein VNP95_11060 [Thermomicrobiales bacterium]|jgi:uncharacterized membrane protein YidH (DUF202 family)|nr:hypothetical protein [Thermomicrobiales bacterium]